MGGRVRGQHTAEDSEQIIVGPLDRVAVLYENRIRHPGVGRSLLRQHIREQRNRLDVHA